MVRVDKGRVLVVEDDRAVRESLRRSLEFNGYEVATAGGDQGAAGAISVILVAIMLVISGYYVLATVKEEEL